MKEKTIFDYLNNLYFKQDLKYDKKAAPAYLISLWLSHDRSLIDLVNIINEYQFLLCDDLIYKYYYYKVPQGKRYIKWVKKDSVPQEKKEKIEKIREELMLSKQEYEKYKSFDLTGDTKNDSIKKKSDNASSIFL